MSILGAFIVPHPPIIMPQIGKGKEKEIQKTIDSFEKIAEKIAELKPDTIILTSPHSIMYADYFHISPGAGAKGNMEQFGVFNYGIDVKYDQGFTEALSALAQSKGIPAGTEGERDPNLDHATVIPLYFINQKYQDYKLVRIGLSGLSSIEHYDLGKCIQETSVMLDRKVVFVASGDLSHKLLSAGPYGFAKEGPEFDKEVTEAMSKADFMKMITFNDVFCEKAAECGLKSFQIMAGALDGLAVKPSLLSYEGPFGVGYGVAEFEILGRDANRRFGDMYDKAEKAKISELKDHEDPYVKLARYTLEAYIKTGKKPDIPKDLPSELTDDKAGVFVSLKKHGKLRGCIGTIAPTQDSIAKEIWNNAVSAGCKDPRFAPVTADELDMIVYSVDVLGHAEHIDSKDDLDTKKYGVIVTNGSRRGLLLPDLEGVDTADQQIAIAKQKAGIKPNEECSLERFEVIRHR